MFTIINFRNTLERLETIGMVRNISTMNANDNDTSVTVFGRLESFIVFDNRYNALPKCEVYLFDHATSVEVFTSLILPHVYNREDIRSCLGEHGELIGDVRLEYVQSIINIITSQYSVEFATDVLKHVIRSLGCDVHPDSMIVQIYYSMLFKGAIDAKYNRIIIPKKD